MVSELALSLVFMHSVSRRQILIGTLMTALLIATAFTLATLKTPKAARPICRVGDPCSYSYQDAKWKLSSVDPTGRRLHLAVFQRLACDEFDRVDTRETPTEVEVRVILRSSDIRQPCSPAQIKRVERVVRLDASLGDRLLLGECSEDCPVPDLESSPHF